METLPGAQYSEKNCELLENAQRRATKLAPALRDLSYVDRINALDLPSLYYRRARGDMIETYKYMSGIYAVDAEYIKPDKSLTWVTVSN